MTRQEQILRTITAILDRETNKFATVGRNVMRPNREDKPVISVSLTGDVPAFNNMAVIDWEMTVTTTIALFRDFDRIDEAFLAIRSRIHSALMSNQTLGLGYVQSIKPDEMGEPELDDDGDRPAMLVDLDWVVKYRTSASSIEV